MSVDRLPGWKRLFAELLELRLKPGDFVPQAWVEEQLGISREEVRSLDDANRYHLTMLRGRKAFERLRRQHLVALLWQRDPDGWRVPSAQEQIEHAQHQLAAGMRKELLRAVDWQTNVDVAQLTDAQRAAHADKMAKLASLRSMTRSALRELPAPKKADDE
jgi:hypothetical protein